MFNKIKDSFFIWFKETTRWWFRTLFGRIGILFALAAFVLVFLTYYVFNSTVSEKDTILDIQDAFLHLEFVQSWEGLQDTASLRKKLNSILIKAFVYELDADTSCEKSILIWSNSQEKINLCNYGSYNDSYQMNQNEYGFEFNKRYLSFGEYELPNQHFPAVFIVQNNKKYLLITDVVLFSEAYPLIPSMVLAVVFMFLLYLLIRRFLLPINLMEQRIIALQRGDLDSQIKVSGNDELALLSTNFNSLISEVKQLLKQKERLLSEVSHELKTPLSKIRLLLAMLPKQEKVKKIDQQIKYLDSMITNILLSDSLSSPYSNLELSTFLFEDLIKQSIQISINDNINVLSKETIKIHGDRIKLSIVFKNIFDNIKKYSNSTKAGEVVVSQNKKNKIIVIRDFGVGIPKSIIDIVDRPFVRNNKNKVSGFGLGLAICKKVIECHGGNLAISNHKKGGAKFVVCLPHKIRKENNE
ncbi:MAG: hypothetical protein CMG64_00285 [Candidatus Marinimicrobia bacterium]|nr:hypothetical protein [Candidatus Neomarinimicrobiota bacterium]